MPGSLSYCNSAIQEDYIYETLPDRLKFLAKQDGEKEAFVYYDFDFQRTSISRKDLCSKSLDLAKTLVRNGLRNRSVVGVCMANSLNMVVANIAAVCAGGVPTYFATNLKDGSDLKKLLNRMKCETLIIDTNMDDNNWKILQSIWPASTPKSDSVPTVKTIICNGTVPDDIPNRTPLSFLMKQTSDEIKNVQLPTIQPEDLLAYFCTSGTTGEPKVVEYTHFSMFNWSNQCNNVFGINENSRFFCDRTFSWVVGYPRTYLVNGATRVFVDPRLTSAGKSIEKITEIIESEKCDKIYVPNYIASDLLENSHLASNFVHVETMMIAGERFSTEHSTLIGTFTKNIIVFYGTTESGGGTVFKSSNRSEFEDGIIGKPLCGMEAKLIDANGNVVAHGEQGELCLRSAWRFVGYLGDDTKFHSSVDKANWFRTGDIGKIRQDGNIVLFGRQKELISFQTMKFFPWNIEAILKNMPGIQTAFAVGVPDKRSFEAVCACVVPKADVNITTDDIKKYCDEVFLDESTAMVVTYKPVYHVILDTVPLTNSGKVSRMRISETAKNMLGL